MEPKGKKMLKGLGIFFLIWGVLIVGIGFIVKSASGMVTSQSEMQQMALTMQMGMGGQVLENFLKMMGYGLMINGVCFFVVGIFGIAFCKVLHMGRCLAFFGIVLIVVCAINLGLGLPIGFVAAIGHIVNIFFGLLFLIGAERNVHSLSAAKALSKAAKNDALSEKAEQMKAKEPESENLVKESTPIE